MSIAAAVGSLAERPRTWAAVDTGLRAASALDAADLHALIVEHVAEGRLLPRDLDEIALHAHRFVVATREQRVVACAELAPLSRDVAELRSLVVHRNARDLGLGSALIGTVVDRAAGGGFDRLCAFTHAPSFFVRRDFSIVPHIWLPEKIVTDCHSCPHFRRCGQYAVVRELRRTPRTPARQAVLHG